MNGFAGVILYDLAKSGGLLLNNCTTNTVPARFENFLAQHSTLNNCTEIYYGDSNGDKAYNDADVSCLLSRVTGGLDNTSVCTADNRLLDLNGDESIDLNDLVSQLQIIGNPAYHLKYYFALDWRSERWAQTVYPFLSDADDYGTNFAACLNNVDPVTGVNVFNPPIN